MKLFEKKVILITGGTGSFGKTITKYFLDYNLKEIRVFSRDEKSKRTWVFKSNCKIETIGTRHGEKLFETLISKEEMMRTKDLGNYYCINADYRDLNYNKYFVEGEKKLSDVSDYTSHNTNRLNKEEVKRLLLRLNIVKESLND